MLKPQKKICLFYRIINVIKEGGHGTLSATRHRKNYQWTKEYLHQQKNREREV